MAGWEALLPLVLDIIAKNKRGPKVAEIQQQLQDDGDLVSRIDYKKMDPVDRDQQSRIEELEVGLRDARRAITALAGQNARLAGRVDELELDEEEEPR